MLSISVANFSFNLTDASSNEGIFSNWQICSHMTRFLSSPSGFEKPLFHIFCEVCAVFLYTFLQIFLKLNQFLQFALHIPCVFITFHELFNFRCELFNFFHISLTFLLKSFSFANQRPKCGLDHPLLLHDVIHFSYPTHFAPFQHAQFIRNAYKKK